MKMKNVSVSQVAHLWAQRAPNLRRAAAQRDKSGALRDATGPSCTEARGLGLYHWGVCLAFWRVTPQGEPVAIIADGGAWSVTSGKRTREAHRAVRGIVPETHIIHLPRLARVEADGLAAVADGYARHVWRALARAGDGPTFGTCTRHPQARFRAQWADTARERIAEAQRAIALLPQLNQYERAFWKAIARPDAYAALCAHLRADAAYRAARGAENHFLDMWQVRCISAAPHGLTPDERAIFDVAKETARAVWRRARAPGRKRLMDEARKVDTIVRAARNAWETCARYGEDMSDLGGSLRYVDGPERFSALRDTLEKRAGDAVDVCDRASRLQWPREEYYPALPQSAWQCNHLPTARALLTHYEQNREAVDAALALQKADAEAGNAMVQSVAAMWNAANDGALREADVLRYPFQNSPYRDTMQIGRRLRERGETDVKATIIHDLDMVAARIAEQARERAAREAREREAREARERVANLPLAERVAIWRTGGHAPIPATVDGSALARVSGQTVHTSQGASVPLADALRLYRLSHAVRARGVAFTPSEPTYAGGFKIDRVSDNGTARVGCHLLSYAQQHACAVDAARRGLIPRDAVFWTEADVSDAFAADVAAVA